jgi:hypothetical protein
MEMRSFSDYLRSVDDAAFLNLFNARPDLITPVPSDIASLAVRACSAPSLARAIDSLNQWQYQVLEAAASINEPFTEKQVIGVDRKGSKVCSGFFSNDWFGLSVRGWNAFTNTIARSYGR